MLENVFVCVCLYVCVCVCVFGCVCVCMFVCVISADIVLRAVRIAKLSMIAAAKIRAA